MRRHLTGGKNSRGFAGIGIAFGAIIAVALAALMTDGGAASATSAPTAIVARHDGSSSVVGTVSGIPAPFPRVFDIDVTGHRPGDAGVIVHGLVGQPADHASPTDVLGLPDAGAGEKPGAGSWLLVALIFAGGMVALAELAATFSREDE